MTNLIQGHRIRIEAEFDSPMAMDNPDAVEWLTAPLRAWLSDRLTQLVHANAAGMAIDDRQSYRTEALRRFNQSIRLSVKDSDGSWHCCYDATGKRVPHGTVACKNS